MRKLVLRPPAGLNLLSVRAGGAGLASDSLRPVFAFRFQTAQPVEVVETPCGILPPTCRARLQNTARADFFDRPEFERPEKAGAYGMVVRPQGGVTPLVTVRLPWPGGPANAH